MDTISIRSPEDLARKLGIDVANFLSTLNRWVALCSEGRDSDYGRGDSAFDCWWGDPDKKGQKEATLGALQVAPYYAVEIHSGTLGTKGGPKVDAQGRVIGVDGDPISGLYAAGNVMGSPFGMTYGGAGGTLGPAMVYGYLAASHAMARND